MCPPRKIFASVSLRKSTGFTISEVRANNQNAAVILKPTHSKANSPIGEGPGRAVRAVVAGPGPNLSFMTVSVEQRYCSVPAR